ncbi:GNAT family N-acetyltransferase [Solirubrobacter soli]|uniref:GNAT family N-acetyltransferase n=1 Tax=Solirubrobacter soli TaxID=363832 RepID=UPI0005676882|nr:GNAT family N-acetyltransferase [Solirubrobacter soli]
MELRPATREEFDDFGRAVLSAFHQQLTDADRERYGRIDEPERSLAWFDGGRIVATAGVYTRELTVPGAVVPCAAVTAVAVVATHRRRGLLTAMMRRQLEDLHARGDPVAVLWASEGGIYGRFGYGIAARAARLVARRPQARIAAASNVGGPLRAGPAGEHVEPMRAVHERVRPQRPGMLDRRGPWWHDRLSDPESARGGAQPLRAVVDEDGYALYAVRPDSDEDGPAGEVRVRELVAATPTAHARLWAFLLDQDLTRTITWRLAPVDEPLWLALTDPRAVRMTLTDSLWARLVDVAAALSARSYAHDTDVVIAVADEFCPWNTGRYRLSAGGCERTRAAADLELDVSSLGAAYLGGTSLRALAAAGRVRELTAGAVARGAAALRGEVEPWCPEVF